MTHKFVNVGNILTDVTAEDDCDVIIASGAWADSFMPHYLDHIQRNHKLCLDKMQQRYEYVFITTQADYNKYKNRFIIPNITFLIMVGGRLMGGWQLDYACKRKKPIIMLGADCLHTSNLITNLLTKYAHYDVCGAMVQRVCYQLVDVIRDREQQISYEDIFEPREFLRLCLPNLYPTEKRYFMDNYKAAYNGMYWPVRRDGVLIGELIRAFHLGIVYVKHPLTALHGAGLDSNPFLGNLATPETIGMITDSDDGYVVDVSTATYVRSDYKDEDQTITVPDPLTFTNYWKNVRGNGVAPVNESLMGYSIAMHSEPLNQEWLDLAKSTDEFVTSVYGGNVKNKELTWRVS